jgi:hypothetical protein
MINVFDKPFLNIELGGEEYFVFPDRLPSEFSANRLGNPVSDMELLGNLFLTVRAIDLADRLMSQGILNDQVAGLDNLLGAIANLYATDAAASALTQAVSAVTFTVYFSGATAPVALSSIVSSIVVSSVASGAEYAANLGAPYILASAAANEVQKARELLSNVAVDIATGVPVDVSEVQNMINSALIANAMLVDASQIASEDELLNRDFEGDLKELGFNLIAPALSIIEAVGPAQVVGSTLFKVAKKAELVENLAELILRPGIIPNEIFGELNNFYSSSFPEPYFSSESRLEAAELFGFGEPIFPENGVADTISLANAVGTFGAEDGSEVAKLFLESLGITVENVSYAGSESAAFLVSDFEIPGTSIDYQGGIMLSSGGFPGPSNTDPGFTVVHGTTGDSDLDVVGQEAFPDAGQTQDASILEFRLFVDDPSQLSFDLVFGSDEYPEFANSDFVDVAAVFVNGENVALFPGSDEPLSITSENVLNNLADNRNGTFAVEWDGFAALRLTANLDAGWNDIKVGVADTGDSALDSAIYLTDFELATRDQDDDAQGGDVRLKNVGGPLDNSLVASNTPEEYTFYEPSSPSEPNVPGSLSGTASSFNNDVVTNFKTDDEIRINQLQQIELLKQVVELLQQLISIKKGSAIIEIDEDLDGSVDSVLTLEGDFENSRFNVEIVEDDVVLTLEELGLTEGSEDGEIAVNYVPQGEVLITGIATEGNALIADTSGLADADGLGTLSYAWLRDGVAFGATGATYDLIQADVGSEISVAVSYTDGGGTNESVTSAVTAEVANVNDPVTGGMLISGDPVVGGVLTSDDSNIADADGINRDATTYYWTRDGNFISGATEQTYVVTEEDQGKLIYAGIRVVDNFGDVTFRSGANVFINSPPSGAVTIIGSAELGQTISADISGINEPDEIITDTVSYQWRRDGVDIPGPGDEGPSYVLTQDDVGAEITVQMTYVDEGGTEEEFISAVVVPVIPGQQINGTPDPDDLIGGLGSDTIQALAGVDTITASSGNDEIDGGEGTDTVIYSGNQSSYTLTLSPTATTITDRRDDGNGTDTLIDMEFLDFDTDLSEGPFNLSVFGGPAGLSASELGSFVELYIAYFNRAPDAVGLNFWGTQFANGLTLEEMAALFGPQNETRAAYPEGTSNNEFATTVYTNVLGRTPDQGGIDFWVGQLDRGAVGRDQFILEVLQGAKSDPKPALGQDFVDQQIADKLFLETKTDIGAYFAVHKGMSDVDDAVAAMALFDGSAGSVDNAVAAIDGFYADALDPSTGEFLMPLVGVLNDPFAIA